MKKDANGKNPIPASTLEQFGWAGLNLTARPLAATPLAAKVERLQGANSWPSKALRMGFLQG